MSRQQTSGSGKRSKAQRSPAVARGRAQHLVFFWVAAAVAGLVIFGKWQYGLVALVVAAVLWFVIRAARQR